MNETWRDVPAGTRVVVAMSGGVDSSVAAALLVERGCEVVGITMKNFCYSEIPEEYADAACCSSEAIEDARRVARQLGIVHHVLDFEGPFREAVIDPFVAEYAAGRTPNPCTRCNRLVRFPRLWTKARLLEAEWVATGHYARAVVTEGKTGLYRARDRAKDQTYYLWGLTNRLLERTLFPLGDWHKDDVRRHAASVGISTAERPESQDICFIPDKDLRGFLEDHLALHPELAESDRFGPGPIVAPTGERIGTHEGSGFFTVGQRRGLGVAADAPLYVTEIEDDNTLVAGPEKALFKRGLVAGGLNWIDPPDDCGSTRVEVQIRYRAEPTPATIERRPGGHIRVLFDELQRAVAPGQSVVFYHGDQVLGGGTIAESID